MPVTRSANAAIDKVTPQRAEVAGALAEYGGTDLLCYRAGDPAALAAEQARCWDPLLDWAAETLGARLIPAVGVMPQAQSAAATGRLAARVQAMAPFPLTAFHDLVRLSGSLILALAVTDGRLTAVAAWDLSRLDEEWQARHWGRDAQADAAAAATRAAFLHAERFWLLCTSPEARS
jgi:chaperone required for assembly of F1-ATPase